MPEASKALETIINTGVLGAICVLLMLTVYGLHRLLINSMESRISELVTFKETIDKNTEAVREASSAIRQAVEEIRRVHRG